MKRFLLSISARSLASVFIALLVTGSAFAKEPAFEQEIKSRQDTFALIEEKSDLVENLLDEDKPDWQKIMLNSQHLVAHAANLKALFPIGSHEGSRAKVFVWEKPEKFNQLLLELNMGFQQLETASQRNMSSEAEAGLERAQDSCKSCHRINRSLW